MRDKIRQQYDSLYLTQESVYGTAPEKIVEKVHHYVSSGSVFDVGGGEGRNALYLAAQGYEVTVQDMSEVGLAKLDSLADKVGLSVQTVVADTAVERLTATYAVFVYSFILHHLPTVDVERVLTEHKAATEPGGCHVVATFLARGGLYERNTISGRFYPAPEALCSLYSDWNVEICEVTEIVSQARNKQGERMSNDAVYFLAKKPK